jgi:hypothetical protein
MAAYPTLNAQRSSATVRNGGQEAARATNGTLKMRRLYTAEKMNFTVDHWLTDAQKSTLESFYQTNRDLDVSFTWAEDAATYTVRFSEPPQYLRMPGWWQARVSLLEV